MKQEIYVFGLFGQLYHIKMNENGFKIDFRQINLNEAVHKISGREKKL